MDDTIFFFAVDLNERSWSFIKLKKVKFNWIQNTMYKHRHCIALNCSDEFKEEKLERLRKLRLPPRLQYPLKSWMNLEGFFYVCNFPCSSTYELLPYFWFQIKFQSTLPLYAIVHNKKITIRKFWNLQWRPYKEPTPKIMNLFICMFESTV